jgi:hypothetical protein
MRTFCGWLYNPLITNIKRGRGKEREREKRRFWVGPTLGRRKMCDGDELLLYLRNFDVALSGELRSSIIFFGMSSEDFEFDKLRWSNS